MQGLVSTLRHLEEPNTILVLLTVLALLNSSVKLCIGHIKSEIWGKENAVKSQLEERFDGGFSSPVEVEACVSSRLAHGQCISYDSNEAENPVLEAAGVFLYLIAAIWLK